jgi:hypothetical protein
MKSSNVDAHLLAGCVASPGFALAIGTELWLRSLSPGDLVKTTRKLIKIVAVMYWILLIVLGCFADAILKDESYKQTTIIPLISVAVLAIGAFLTWRITMRHYAEINKIAREMNI